MISTICQLISAACGRLNACHASNMPNLKSIYMASASASRSFSLDHVIVIIKSENWSNDLLQCTNLGKPPVVVARGGCSGVFPESSSMAQKIAISFSSAATILYCDLQLSKDAVGFCHSDLRLENYTTIADVYPKGQKSYTVNGVPINSWFAVDYTSNQLLSDVSLVQNILSRTDAFDASEPLGMLEDIPGLRPAGIWINVQYPTFLKERGLDAVSFLLDVKKSMKIEYISSPEVSFLKALNGKVEGSKLVFQFLSKEAMEFSTKKTYGSLLTDLSTIKQFATGILVPKTFIWPIGADQYLQPHTTLVADAHKLGLEVYASGFANDMSGSYNYNYDPTAEYLQFIDNSFFSVDGLLTDFPTTASGAIECFARNSKNGSTVVRGAPMVITHNGASGMFAGCTDLAYQQAVDDGADILDCAVQMSRDGVAFCMASPDLVGTTDAAVNFAARSTVIPEIQSENGIFSFDLAWSEIQSLKPSMKSPFLTNSNLARNPKAKNQGKFMKLSEFLDFAEEKGVGGILINMQNAAYLASKKSLGMVDAVKSALSESGFKESGKLVLIQSDDSSVLSKFDNSTSSKRVLRINETISDVTKPAAQEIKKFADAVSIPRSSIVRSNSGFLVSWTGVVDELRAANLSVFVSVLRNEFVAIAFDFYADPVLELATYKYVVGVDGYVTEFPATARAYIRSPCFGQDADLEYKIPLVYPGNMLSLASPGALSPATAPAPVLEPSDVTDPPLPEIPRLKESRKGEASASAPSSQPPASAQGRVCIDASHLLLAALCFLVLSYRS